MQAQKGWALHQPSGDAADAMPKLRWVKAKRAQPVEAGWHLEPCGMDKQAGTKGHALGHKAN